MQYRKGSRFGHDTVVDGMLKDGLWDVYNDYAMGMCGELCSEQHTITREEQVYSIVATLICLTCLCNIISFASFPFSLMKWSLYYGIKNLVLSNYQQVKTIMIHENWCLQIIVFVLSLIVFNLTYEILTPLKDTFLNLINKKICFYLFF